jgi:hypothetical protein
MKLPIPLMHKRNNLMVLENLYNPPFYNTPQIYPLT